MKKHLFRRARKALATASLALCVSASASAQQGGTTRYLYDESGRLHVVISPSGEAVVYEYDAAGNPTAVRRLAADALALFNFSPREGFFGDLVTFVGFGFGAGVTEVSFSGATARVVEVTPSTVVAEVPEGATTGPVTITTARGAVTTSTPFVIRGLRVSPKTARLLFGESLRFTVEVVLNGDQGVTWSVSGAEGGNATVGTISADGLYTAPQRGGRVAVRATSVAAPELSDEATVDVRDPNELSELRAPGVSVRRGPAKGASPFALPLSVRYGFAEGLTSARSAATSVRYGAAGIASPLAPLISVRYGSPLTQTTAAGSVSVTSGPHVTSVAPAAAARGTTVTLTITGANLSGASALHFISPSGALAAGLAVTNVSVSADGMALTATLSVAGTTAAGQYVVVVVTPAGDSLTTAAGGNLLQIN